LPAEEEENKGGDKIEGVISIVGCLISFDNNRRAFIQLKQQGRGAPLQ